METVQPIPEDPVIVSKPGKRKVYEKQRKIEKGGEFPMGEFVEVGQNWIPENEGDSIEGYVGHPQVIDTDFGPAQAVLVGDKRVLISAGLQALPQLERQYVRITYQGMEKSKKRKGKEFRKFRIERRVEE